MAIGEECIWFVNMFDINIAILKSRVKQFAEQYNKKIIDLILNYYMECMIAVNGGLGQVSDIVKIYMIMIILSSKRIACSRYFMYSSSYNFHLPCTTNKIEHYSKVFLF